MSAVNGSHPQEPVSPTTALRLRLLENGCTPLPAAAGKEVFLTEWRTRPIDRKEVLAWEPRLNEWPSTGNRCTDQPCLDLDVRHPEAAEACEQKVRDWSDGRGELLVRFGLAPKRLIPFRTDTPFKKRLLVYRAPNGDRHRIELLADGQQAIFYGYHVEAKQDYRWHADRDPLKVPPREWPSITELEADELLAALDELLIEQFGYERVNPEKPNGHAPSAIHVRDVDAALAALDYRGVGGGGNMHDTALGCINALIVQGNPTTHAVEEVGATIGVYAAGNPLCARWSPEKVRRILEGMAFSFINKFPDFADRLPPELYAARQVRRGQGVLEPKLEYDRLHRCWHYPEPPAGNGTDKGPASAPAAEQKFRLVPFGQLRPGNEPGYLVDELIPLRGIVLIWGKRKCLKSFWTYDLSFHIARYRNTASAVSCRALSSIARSKARTATKNGQRHCGATTKCLLTRKSRFVSSPAAPT